MSQPPPPSSVASHHLSCTPTNQNMNMSEQVPGECSPAVPDTIRKTPLPLSTPSNPSKCFFPSKRKLDLSSSSSHSTPAQPKAKKVRRGPGQAPQSDNSRTGWSLLLLKNEGKIQIKPMVQSARGKKGLFTSAGPNSPQRPPWDSVLDCELVKNLNKDGTGTNLEYLCTSSDNNRKPFRVDLIDPFMNSKDPFSQKTSEMVVNNPKLLGNYISLMSRSKNFFNHSAKYDENGFNKDGGGICIDKLKEAEGSIEGLIEFIKIAEENCLDIGRVGSEKDVC